MIPSVTRRLIDAVVACVIAGALMSGGCQTAQIPDPNDPANASIVSIEEVQIAVRGVADEVGIRVALGTVSKADGEAEQHRRVSEFARALNDDSITPQDAWRAGEIYMIAGDYQRAEKYLRLAVKNPTNDDRRTNDLVRLGTVLAREGKVKEAIATAEQSFSAVPTNKGSILLGVTKELVPAALGKGYDAGLARLIEGAINQHLEADVPTNTPEGKAFHAAKAFHIREAYDQAIQIWQRLGRTRDATKLLRTRRDVLNQLSHSR